MLGAFQDSKYQIVKFNARKCCAACDRLRILITRALYMLQRWSWMSQAQFPSYFIKRCHLFSNHSRVSCLIYGAVSVCCYSSVIFSTALFLQPTANSSPSPRCWTILNHILRSQIPSSCQTPFLILSTPMPPHLSRLPGGILQRRGSESSQTWSKINSDLHHHVFSIMPFFLNKVFYSFICHIIVYNIWSLNKDISVFVCVKQCAAKRFNPHRI